MPLSRPPGPRLRPFVSLLWASEAGSQGRHHGGRERVLPSGDIHVVMRLGHTALRIFSGADDPLGQTIGSSIVGGARSSAYAKLVDSQDPTVGFVLRPGAARLLLAASGLELAERHANLEDLWPASTVALLRERLQELDDPSAQLLALEEFLEQRLPDQQGLNLLIVSMASQLARGISIGCIVSCIGQSHRHLAATFARETGLSPKLFQRVRRFNRLLDEFHSQPGSSFSGLAVQFGYADQAHLCRDFREFAGLTPDEYRRFAPTNPRHVPVMESDLRSDFFKTRRGTRATSEHKGDHEDDNLGSVSVSQSVQR